MTYKDLNLKTKQIIKSTPQFLLSNILLVVLLVIGIISLFIIYFNAIVCHFYGVTFQANGQLLGTVLTAIGGCAVIYGLYLNNKRIKEQTRQNDIAMEQTQINADNNNDKRFGEAIGYLNSDKAGVAIGGVYALHQLAKEDRRYISIVAKLYCSFLRERSKKSYVDGHGATESFEILQSVINLLFNDNSIFEKEEIDLSHTFIQNIDFNGCVTNCSFYQAVIKKCTFQFGVLKCNFSNADISETLFLKESSHCDFINSIFNTVGFGTHHERMLLSHCFFMLNSNTESRFYCKNIHKIDFTALAAGKFTFEADKIMNSEFYLDDKSSVEFIDVHFDKTSIIYNGNVHFERCTNIPSQ